MLILTRRIGEAILLSPSDTVDPTMTVGELFADGPIDIAITNIDGRQAKVSITAPESITILRDELMRMPTHEADRNEIQLSD